jgi:transcription elongation GreA/GreB family factor
MPFTNGWFDRSINANHDPRRRELEIQIACNQRRIAEIERDSLSLMADAKTRSGSGRGTIVSLHNPDSGKEEFFLIEASKAAEFIKLREEKECLQKRITEIERELSYAPSAVSTKEKNGPEQTSPFLQPGHSDSNHFSPDAPDSLHRYNTSDVTNPDSAATEQSSGSGFGTLLAFLTAIGLTLLLL